MTIVNPSEAAPDAADARYDDALARRNAGVLALGGALSGANASIVIGSGGLVGALLAPDPSLATVPVTSFVLGTALASTPAALLMQRIGRREGFVLGGVIGIVGAVVAALGVASASFFWFCAGTLLAGAYGAFAQQYRFAAADTASPAFRPKAISWVMAGGVAAGVIGPQTVIHTQYASDVPYFATYLAQGGLALLACLVLVALRAPAVRETHEAGARRPLMAIARSPRFITAALAGMMAYGLMSLVMTAAPLAMVAYGHSAADALWGIQWHVIAMFGPSFFTGSLIVRFGAGRVTGVGFVLLALSAVLALTGLAVWQFWGALILLGLGWNFGFVGATALIAALHSPAERGKVQALNEGLVFGTVALASLGSGQLLDAFSWEAINMAVLPVCAAGLLLLTFAGRRERRMEGV